MNFALDQQDDFLIIRLSGISGPNERLLIKKSLILSLRPSDGKAIVDLRHLEGGEAVYDQPVVPSSGPNGGDRNVRVKE
jgi:hypothetical protein